MPEEIIDRIYRIPVPLPGNPLKELNAYLIKGGGRNLLIDTGFRQPACREALFAGLRALGLRRGEVEVLLTHLHSDHSGLAPEAARDRTIYISAADRPTLDDLHARQVHWDELEARFQEEGFIREGQYRGRRRTYRLTEDGLARYRRELERLRRCVADGESEEPGEEEAP